MGKCRAVTLVYLAFMAFGGIHAIAQTCPPGTPPVICQEFTLHGGPAHVDTGRATLAPGTVAFAPAVLRNAFFVALMSSRLQLSQTDTGTPADIALADGRTIRAMSYLQFGPVLKAFGAKDLAFDLPVTEQGIGNWAALIGVLSHGVAFADRLRFRINDLNADIDSGAIDVTTGPDSVNLSIRLQSGKPTIMCEANTYTFLPFAVIAIPVGWRSEFCPQIDMTNIVVTVSFVSAVVDGQLSYNDARVVLNADISAGPLGDALQPIVDFRSKIKSGFESQVQKMVLGSGFRSALTRLFMQMVSGQAQKTIANITGVSVDQSGLTAEYPLQP
jgi:hypothetical protein